MFKYTPYTQKKIEGIFTELGYKVRYEKGHFQSGYCLVENKKIVVINRFFETEGKINCMVDILNTIEVEVSLLEEKTLDFFQKSILRTPEENENTLFDQPAENS